jgi:putative peptidoglycan lipid II flippase
MAQVMSVVRDVTSVGSATLASRLLGFLRDMGIAAVLGAGPLSDAYFAALQIPNLFRRLVADGALNASFVPVWSGCGRVAGMPIASPGTCSEQTLWCWASSR